MFNRAIAIRRYSHLRNIETIMLLSTDCSDKLLVISLLPPYWSIFRYHNAVLKMKELINAHGGHVMSINARYYLAYEFCNVPTWGDVTTSGGPIVEQATHLCDVMRFLAGEVTPNSVHTICLRHTHPAGM